MRAMICRAWGAPEVLRLDRVEDPTPGPGEVLIAVKAAGVNRPDVLQRQGLYPPPKAQFVCPRGTPRGLRVVAARGQNTT